MAFLFFPVRLRSILVGIAQGLFETDFTGADKQSEKWLLTQGAMAEMYGRMSGVKLDQTK